MRKGKGEGKEQVEEERKAKNEETENLPEGDKERSLESEGRKTEGGER